MKLTQERADILTGILTTDEGRAEKLFALDAEEALKQINALGNDFSLEELREYDMVLGKAVGEKSELDAKELDDVAGGAIPVLLAYAGYAAIGAVAGYVASRKWF